MDKFIDRKQAGTLLAKELQKYLNKANIIALGLPRGGVPVAYEIAKILCIPLDVFIVRKLGVPWHKELAMGAISTGGITVLNYEVINALKIPKADIEDVIKIERNELNRREALYRSNKPFPNLHEKIILLVDDGIATGSTMKAAVSALSQYKPEQIIIVAPVAALSTYKELLPLVDNIVCPLRPINFRAVALWYEHFTQIEDNEVCELLQKANQTNS